MGGILLEEPREEEMEGAGVAMVRVSEVGGEGQEVNGLCKNLL